MIMRRLYILLAAVLLACCTTAPEEKYAPGENSGGEEIPGGTSGTLANRIIRIDLAREDIDSDPDYWEKLHALVTLQGIVNREKATLYINYVRENGENIDEYWWNKCSEEGGWLSGAYVHRENSIESVIRLLSDRVDGAVVYDPAVAATSNVASAVAGCDNLIAIRYSTASNSLYARLVRDGFIKPLVWLVGMDGKSIFTGSGDIPGRSFPSTGSAKCDAYYWFIENYIVSGKCNTEWAGYYIDQYWLSKSANVKKDLHCLTNHDFFVSKKGFFFDLCPWGEDVNDDPGQPAGTDLKTFRYLMLMAYQFRQGRMCYIGGFPAWSHKYTDVQGGHHGAVATEWEFCRLISQYNGCMDADAINNGALANASFWQHYPLKDEYPQKWVTHDELRQRGLLKEDGTVNLDGDREYYIFYAGDWDASSWIYQHAFDVWDDPMRGSIPIMWPIGPALCLRSPQVMDYFYRTATPNDYFVAADNGAGYLAPGELAEPRESGMPSGLEEWKNHCAKYYKQWGMTVTGFIIDGNARHTEDCAPVLDIYSEFSPNGIVLQRASVPLKMYKGMPVMKASSTDLNKDNNPVAEAAQLATNIANERASTGQRFHWSRVVLARPSWLYRVVEYMEANHPNYILLDAPSFFELLKIYGEQEALN